MTAALRLIFLSPWTWLAIVGLLGSAYAYLDHYGDVRYAEGKTDADRWWNEQISKAHDDEAQRQKDLLAQYKAEGVAEGMQRQQELQKVQNNATQIVHDVVTADPSIAACRHTRGSAGGLNTVGSLPGSTDQAGSGSKPK